MATSAFPEPGIATPKAPKIIEIVHPVIALNVFLLYSADRATGLLVMPAYVSNSGIYILPNDEEYSNIKQKVLTG